MKKKLDYTWVIIGACILMVFTTLGFCSSTKGLYLKPITEVMGIGRGVYSLNDTCRFVSTAVINIFFGALIGRFGARKLIGAGFIALILACVTYAFATSFIVFCIGGLLLGLGLAWTTTTVVGSVVNKWCKEKKGTVMGIILAANGLGGALATQIVKPIIYQEGNKFGYKNAYLLTALILLVVGTLIVTVFRDNPKTPQTPKQTESVKREKKRGADWGGIDYKKGIRKPYFYVAAICIFFSGFVLQGITGISVAHMSDMGLDEGYVASVMSIHWIALSIFKFLTGISYDKFGLRVTTTICTVMTVVVMVVLMLITNSPAGKMLALAYCIFAAMALPLETIMLPIFASDLFGQKSVNKFMGLFVSVNTAGYAVGAPVVNLSFDVFGNYTVALVASAVIMICVTFAMQYVITAAHNERKRIVD